MSMQIARHTAGWFYRPELDVVRSFAFLLVFFHHTLPKTKDQYVAHLMKGFAPDFYATIQALRFGFSLFFILIAFLIFESLLCEREAVGSTAVKQFYICRSLRLWLLYYLGLASE
jgi:peptidoglycan/LPS O-acetylase OafA/YrhL